MYLVQSISKLKKGYIHIDPNSHVKTKALESVKDFLNQRYDGHQILNQVYKTPCFFTFLLVLY